MLKANADRSPSHPSLVMAWSAQQSQQPLAKPGRLGGVKACDSSMWSHNDYHYEQLTLPNIRIIKALSRCYLRATCWSNHVTQCVVAVQADGLV